MLFKILALHSGSCAHPKDRSSRDILISYRKDSALAWFDGATKRYGSKCRAGGIIKALDATVYIWTLNCGSGTNTKAELMGTWETLWLADYLALPCIHLLGDSKVVIDWLSNMGTLQVSSLEGWKTRIISLSRKF
jgi:ribonuclease HI